jgi:hypothetical protein
MIGSLLDHWKYSWAEVWGPLAEPRKAPGDLFVELYRAAADVKQKPTDYRELELVLNDPVRAKEAFQQIRAQDFGSEVAVISFTESAFHTVSDFKIRGYERLYKRLVKSFIRKYNLRYQVDNPLQLRLVLPGAFASFYEELGRLHGTDGHLRGLMSDFEQSFGSYVRSKQPHDLKDCIVKAIVYAEGVAAKTHGQNDTLGALCDRLTCWPHATIRESVKKIYGFSSDYPGIRHAGTPDSKLRELECRDAIVVSMVLLSFSGYLSNEVKIEDILVP